MRPTVDDLAGIIEHRHEVEKDGTLIFFPSEHLYRSPSPWAFLI
ncbi:MAG: hypothetical protein Q9N34_03645 [Aquificota bacterium]|nr:hypothetical protein [Aquificota bacterium]